MITIRFNYEDKTSTFLCIFDVTCGAKKQNLNSCTLGVKGNVDLWRCWRRRGGGEIDDLLLLLRCMQQVVSVLFLNGVYVCNILPFDILPFVKSLASARVFFRVTQNSNRE